MEVRNHSYSKKKNKISFTIIRLILLIIFINSFISNFSFSAEAILLPYAQIEIDQEVKECEVGLSKEGVVNYSCKLVFNPDYFTQQAKIITLTPKTDREGWGASISPPQLVLMPFQLERDFKLFVIAPPRTSSRERVNVTITGSWLTNPGMESGTVEPNGVVTNVKPFYNFIVIPVNDYIKTWPTYTVEFELEIKNQGNAEEEFKISINETDKLSSAGFQIELKKSSIVVAERSSERFKFKVSGPQKFYPWKSHQTPIIVHIQGVNSEYAGKRVEREWTCILYEVGIWIPEPCIFGIIFVIVLVIILVWAKRSNRLLVISVLIN